MENKIWDEITTINVGEYGSFILSETKALFVERTDGGVLLELNEFEECGDAICLLYIIEGTEFVYDESVVKEQIRYLIEEYCE